MDYDSAVNLLSSIDTWCEGAEALVQLDDRRALLPLMQAYERGVEASRACLLEAMKTLNAKANAHEFYDSTSAEQRRIAIHMMELFPDESHLKPLEQATIDPDGHVRQQAGRALVCQYQTAAWQELMTHLLAVPDERVRSWIIEGLGYSTNETARRALQSYLPQESDPALRRKLERILKSPQG